MKKHKPSPYITYKLGEKWGVKVNPEYVFYYYDTHGVPPDHSLRVLKDNFPKNKNDMALLWWNCMNREHSEVVEKWMREDG